MMSKDEERKALAKIEKIIEEAGGYNDSYIGFAFDGCADIARRNIEEDAAYSWKERALSAEKKLQQAAAEVETYKERAKAQDIRADEANHTAHEAQARADDLQGELNKLYQIKQQYEALQRVYEQETTKLKAKLYDLITKEN